MKSLSTEGAISDPDRDARSVSTALLRKSAPADPVADASRGKTAFGYFVPEFPGQTHIFFGREIEKLNELGAAIRLISTRRPRLDNCRHESLTALANDTHYVIPVHWAAAMRACCRRPGAVFRAIGLWMQTSRTPADALRSFIALFCGAALCEFARRRGLGHIHVHSCGNAALVAAYCKRFGGPTYSLTLHNPLKTFGPYQRQKWRDAEFGIVITRGLLAEIKDQLGAALPQELYVAPMGVDPDCFRRPSAKPYAAWNGEGPFRIFSCGRLNPSKGHSDLVRAVGILREKGYDVRLAIAGSIDNPQSIHRQELESLIHGLQLQDNVELLGAVSESQIMAQLAAAHAFALLSWAEPLGVVYLEAMSMEVPVLGTDAGGVPELIEHGRNGLLVRPTDPVAAADALLGLMQASQVAKRLGEAGRLTVIERFSSDQSARILLNAIRNRQADLNSSQAEDGAAHAN